ncbi:uncharacterized protein LOC118348725 [Juglans regia]|uniref:Uncharacterized protein LOC118348725 n=1 Tax=Juglans regia TaxID=51240 RepID=A0A6P9EHA8_JUGRE|nr:uncharacterized protein LOC118348725 [Juglans regia]
MVLDNGRIIEGVDIVHKEAANFFHNFLSENSGVPECDLSEKLVAHEQWAFIPGRSIFEIITLAQEMVHWLYKRNVGGNVMVKLDMAKAYDRVNWGFLLEVFRAFGFSDNFCRLIRQCVESPWFSIMRNETFTDDILIFVNGSKRSTKNLVHILETYEKWSGQIISKDKSALFMSKRISLIRKRGLLRLMGFKEGIFPVTYLGAPLVSGRLTSRIMELLIEKIRKKIAGWKMKLLLHGGRLILFT